MNLTDILESISRNGAIIDESKENGSNEKSGSQSPPQLHALCRALLLHAQDVYHNHSLFLRAKAKKAQEDAAKGNEPKGLARIKKEDVHLVYRRTRNEMPADEQATCQQDGV